MILCPNCQHKEISGAVFCSQCGAQLLQPDTGKTQKVHTAGAKKEDRISTSPLQAPPLTGLNSWLSLHMIESGQILPLADRTEFTLGRAAEGQPIMPDVDLTPYNAYANGVSRLHAVIKQINNKIVVMDLGSSNGTYVNGERLSPYVEQPLSHGDTLFLGKLQLQVLFGLENQ